jgi:chlorobactene glucosyltransferase
VHPPLASLPWLLPFLLLIRLARRRPALADFPEARGPLLSVVIPARNESNNIERVARSVLASRYTPLELIVVDDRSTDDTAEIAGRIAGDDPRLRLIRGAERPDGWYGKPWACVQGFRAARGDLILFADADTEHDPTLLGRAVTALDRTGADLVSVLPMQVCRTWAERIVMPQVFLLLGAHYTPARVNRARSASDVIANGQFILVRRSAYEEVGTHAAVRGEVAEDLALAQEFWRGGKKLFLAYAYDLMRTRMYTDLRSLVEGWSKNLYLGARRAWAEDRWRRTLAPWGAVVAFGFWVVPILGVGAGIAGVPAILGPSLWATGFGVVFWALMSRGMEIPLRFALFYPAGAAIAAWIALRSIARGGRRVEWKGRVYGGG